MNPTIARRALWVVAVLAVAYASFAFLEWRPTGLLISVGLLVLCFPIDMLLAQAERERHLPPHGPVRKWGMNEDALHDQQRNCELPRPRPKIFDRLTPPWLIALLPLILIPIGLLAAPRAAADSLEDAAFLHTLNLFDVTYPSEPVAIALGHSACDSLTSGQSVRRVEIAIIHGGDYTPNDAATILGAAIGAYCDQHMQLISTTTPATRVSASNGGVLR